MMNFEKEMDRAFKIVGLLVKTQITKYANEGRENEALELENSYNTLNRHFENMLDLNFKVQGDKYAG